MMERIEPVTRIEGHMAITILIEKNRVKDLQVNVVEPPRLFEKFMEGKPAEEAVRIAERICGICYVAHGLAAVKAVENAWDVNPPEAAVKLRRLIHAGGFIQSHTLHLAFLALPDIISPEGIKYGGVIGFAKKYPHLCKKAILIRKFGQEITKAIGGRPIHPSGIVPGGVAKPLSADIRDELLKMGREALNNAVELVDLLFDLYEKHDILNLYPEDPTYYMGLIRGNVHETYEARLHVMSPRGDIVDVFDGNEYVKYIGERTSPHSFVKYPFLRANNERYRVGALARVNLAEKMGTPLADKYLTRLRSMMGRISHNVGAYNLARAIELIASVERALELLEDEEILSKDIRAEVRPKAGVGVGVVEAPRGVLIHHYEVDDRGLLRKVNLIVATQQNVPSLEKELFQVTNELLLRGKKLADIEHRLEMIIRAYDPCISCATHLVKLRLMDKGSS
ncbi:MAG: Ni/Fe hydrogenase subunit alpha [Thermoprotei archaeon]|mgnify:CR=1 FL=1|nr:MAG: Ni/Fe hydrogenase subunit alpha [Thermoprotei archaeon]RLF24646.1 MAG: Ni/Fe hydrogenase subunit alpha [Thermoprotei archaeon]